MQSQLGNGASLIVLPSAKLPAREPTKNASLARQGIPRAKPEGLALPWTVSMATLELVVRGMLNHGQYGELIVDVTCDGKIVAEMAMRAKGVFFNLFPVRIPAPVPTVANGGYTQVNYRFGAIDVGPVADGHPLENFAPRYKSSVQALRLGQPRPQSAGVAIPGRYHPVGFIVSKRSDCRCLPMVADCRFRQGKETVLIVHWYADFREGIRGTLHHVASSRMSIRAAHGLAIRSQLFAKAAVPGGGWFPVPLVMDYRIKNRQQYWHLVPAGNAFPTEVKPFFGLGCRLWEMDFCRDPDQVILKLKGGILEAVQRSGIGGKRYLATTPSFLRVSNLTL